MVTYPNPYILQNNLWCHKLSTLQLTKKMKGAYKCSNNFWNWVGWHINLTRTAETAIPI
ncbi:MAG TPA: hypothetical protein V6D50_02800 [Chroococcales cyanobacterium]